jgi:proline racemase
MRIKRVFSTIDTHTAGEPTRTVVGGIPYIPGKSISEKMLYLKEHQDWIRQALMYEPRGNEVMSGVILTEPCDPEADIGVIFIEVGGYLPMCGHDTIGVSTTLIESGIIPVEEGPITRITLDTPAGLVRVEAVVENHSVKEVSFVNVPAFLYAQDQRVSVPDMGEVKLDIAYGGNFYGIVEAAQIGLDLSRENASRIVQTGILIRDKVNEQLEIKHPEKPFINELTHIMFSGLADPGSSADTKNVVVIPPGSIDRSPCGTGTSAKLALWAAKGEISEGSTRVFESIIGTQFKGEVVEKLTIAGYPAVRPRITGSAYVTGINQWIIDPDDPIPTGYLLG